MRQRYHTIIRPASAGFIGWVEEVPGTLARGKTLIECRERLREALQLILETHRDEARLGLDGSCILGSIDIDTDEPNPWVEEAAV
jgi:predicted RNase H-like HicB family nuclease